MSFNPRPHTAGDKSDLDKFIETACFNPRPHTAGDALDLTIAEAAEVSIHARTRRATKIKKNRKKHLTVSIHARTRRATATGCYGYVLY